MDTQTALATQSGIGSAIEQVLIGGDLKGLSPEQRVSYYNKTCESLGLNPLTRPFDYLNLNGKTVLYARKDCTEQLRSNRKVSINIVAREVVEGCYVVTAKASDASGRTDEAIGAVPIDKMQGEIRANAMMKAETKAKRRVTLSFCGLGMLDESEVESIPGSRVGEPERPTPKPINAEIVPPQPAPRASEQQGEKLRASREQITALCAVMTKIGMKTRPEVLAWINERIAPRKVESRLDLTPDEASKCIDLAKTIENEQRKE